MLLKDFVLQTRNSLSVLYGLQESAALTSLVCKEYFGSDSYTHITDPGSVVEDEACDRALSAVRRLLLGEPVQYVLGYAVFCGRRFNVSPSVLIPRPETEIMCREAAGYAGQVAACRGRVRILDLCTGSGCIAWTMAAEIQEADIVAVDISQEALAVASSQTFDRVRAPHFVCADIFDDSAFASIAGDGFDLILSNPPYVLESEKPSMRANVLEHEPALALFVPDTDAQVFNRKLAEICKKFLYTGAVAYVEINEALGNASKAVFEEKGFSNVTVIQDLSGRDRFIKIVK